MKIQFIGDGTASHQVFSYPGGNLEKWQTVTTDTIPPWVETAPARAFLIDGQFNPGPSQESEHQPGQPDAEPAKE